MNGDKRVFNICEKCSCLYQQDTGNRGENDTCLGGGIHEAASPEGSTTPYFVLVQVSLTILSDPVERWYEHAGFRVCRNCHVLSLQQKSERYQAYSDHEEYCTIKHDRHDLDLKGINFQARRAAEESDFTLCKMCGCLYHRTIGKHHCLDIHSKTGHAR